LRPVLAFDFFHATMALVAALEKSLRVANCPAHGHPGRLRESGETIGR
jgi:hypothetical protein